MFGWIVLGAGNGICDSDCAGRAHASPSIARIVSDAIPLPIAFVRNLVRIKWFPPARLDHRVIAEIIEYSHPL
jgi:hypothetical protein